MWVFLRRGFMLTADLPDFIFKTAFVVKNTLFAEWVSIFAIFHLLLVLQSLLLMEKNAKNGGEFYECVRSSEFIKVI